MQIPFVRTLKNCLSAVIKKDHGKKTGVNAFDRSAFKSEKSASIILTHGIVANSGENKNNNQIP